MIFDCAFKFDKQIKWVVVTNFLQLRLFGKVKAYLPPHDFERVIHAFATSHLGYCNSLYVGLDQSSLWYLQAVRNACLLTRKKQCDNITPVLASLHRLPVYFRIQFKILLLVFKSLNGMAPPYLSELLQPHAPSRALRSLNQLLLDICRSRLKNRGD